MPLRLRTGTSVHVPFCLLSSIETFIVTCFVTTSWISERCSNVRISPSSTRPPQRRTGRCKEESPQVMIRLHGPAQERMAWTLLPLIPASPLQSGTLSCHACESDSFSPSCKSDVDEKRDDNNSGTIVMFRTIHDLRYHYTRNPGKGGRGVGQLRAVERRSRSEVSARECAAAKCLTSNW